MAQPNYNINYSLIIFCFTTLFVITETRAVLLKELLKHQGHGSLKKLFVFGDSYADTGNCKKSVSGSWKPPYGITFPGKPAGRFSDGRVLTDYVASYLGIKSPIANYNWRKSVKRSQVMNGMNFAYGGTGVFKTLVNEPNMTTQVKFFQQLLEEKVYSRQDLLNSSIALVSLAGNDYGTYVFQHGNLQDLPTFTKSIISQLVVNLKSIQNLGVQKIVVTAMEPMGCLPRLAVFSLYKNCNESWNSVSMFHNQILQQELQNLNNASNNSVFVSLDLYSAFMSALKRQANNSGNSEVRSSLEPCCVGVSDKYSCGSVDEKGEKKYNVCKNPELSMFWDNIHPTQSGWNAVFSALKSSSLPKLH
ncbi:hypothetical protein Dsin_000354 [Dipteronia sinensis]|uniref:GDSL esterase/lipase n=1 Tax=Dipteronia sinensis TaxID=43782 RepID=A0AAE0EHC2_9ROSI|nr:hypothetical protein Dsin_000354 [Dipteronia sinensis]